ncbi:MAG: hypothetical protein HQM04_05250 [Magnetococcales bacterium]|nr:hypothetical protein [Magnetococcales bacterium]MBF0114431.1 hypothetical protein [Magnetococcales bacterium]
MNMDKSAPLNRLMPFVGGKMACNESIRQPALRYRAGNGAGFVSRLQGVKRFSPGVANEQRHW